MPDRDAACLSEFITVYKRKTMALCLSVLNYWEIILVCLLYFSGRQSSLGRANMATTANAKVYWFGRECLLMITVLLAIILALMCGTARATLIKLEGVPLAYDSASNLYWYTDLASFTGNNYQQQRSMIDSISIQGFSGFHLADAAAVDSLRSSISSPADIQLFSPTDLQYEHLFWTGRTNEVVSADAGNDVYRRVHYFTMPLSSMDSVVHQAFSIEDYSTVIQFPDLGVGAWVVGYQDLDPMPEPGTVLLLGAGMIALALLRRRLF